MKRGATCRAAPRRGAAWRGVAWRDLAWCVSVPCGAVRCVSVRCAATYQLPLQYGLLSYPGPHRTPEPSSLPNLSTASVLFTIAAIL